MAVTIDATVGGASANSHVTLAEADAYMEARLNSTTWDDATADTKNRALVEATRELTVLPWAGLRVTDTQALSWPRDWVTNPDDPNYDYYANNVIPRRISDATCELAFQFVKAGTTDVASRDTTAEVVRKKVDVLETEYAAPYHRITQGLRRYPRVWGNIAPLLIGAGISVPIVRG